MFTYKYQVPEQKRVRIIIHTDCKNEADDQFAVAHALMTPLFDVKGIIAGHFDGNSARYPNHGTTKASYDEIIKILDLMHLSDKYPVFMGAAAAMSDERTPIDSKGTRFIIEEAMKTDQRPLYIFMQGAITDLASAILLEPQICERMTAIWVGGGVYPEGCREFNLEQDIAGANTVFASSMPLWQLPMNVYKQMTVSLAELQAKVLPCGRIGRYLFEQMVVFNNMAGDFSMWPHGEIWGLGDNSAIATLLEEREKVDCFTVQEAPGIDPVSMKYIHGTGYRPIRVYHKVNDRLTLEDMFCKLRLNFPDWDS